MAGGSIRAIRRSMRREAVRRKSGRSVMWHRRRNRAVERAKRAVAEKKEG